jgi:hypothetical protein
LTQDCPVRHAIFQQIEGLDLEEEDISSVKGKDGSKQMFKVTNAAFEYCDAK